MGKVFVDACHGRPTPHTPIWLNRQAGRYMPEYHQVKGDTPSLDFFKNPELAAQATLDAQRILGVDAAIIDVSGKGKSEPVASNDTEEGRAKNRRVEIHVGTTRLKP